MRKEKRAGARTARRPPLPAAGTLELPATAGALGLPAMGALEVSAAGALELPAAGTLELPAIVRRAQEEARSAHALRCLGYRTVRAEYARHRRDGRDTFFAIAHAELWPSMEFVRGWLKGERRRILTNIRMTFLAAMLAAILAGLAFAGMLVLLS